MYFVYILLFLCVGIFVICIFLFIRFIWQLPRFLKLLNIPSIKEIHSYEIKQLSKQLKSDSIAETLNNVLEWQENNIAYWSERAVECIIFWFCMFSPIIASLFIALSNWDLNNFWTYLFKILIDYYDYLLIVFGVIICSLFCKYLMFSSTKILDIVKMILLTFYPPPISPSKVLKYKKAVCRDYAKLTIALLLNLFPNSNLYLITHFMHVAAAIEINGKIYVIDQRLPICEINTWIKRQSSHHKLIGRGYNIHKIIPKENGFDLQKEKYVDKNTLDEKYIEYNWNNIIKQIYSAIDNKKSKFEFKLKNCAIWYDINDTIIKESLYRYIKNILRKELYGKYSKIKNIELKQKGNDIVVHLQFEWG